VDSFSKWETGVFSIFYKFFNSNFHKRRRYEVINPKIAIAIFRINILIEFYCILFIILTKLFVKIIVKINIYYLKKRFFMKNKVNVKQKNKKAILFFIIFTGVLLLLFFIPQKQIKADPVMGQPTPETVLVIYRDDNAYSEQFAQNIISAIQAAGGIVTIRTTGVDDNDGIYDDLGGLNLNNFCEVWDLRFNATHIGWSYSTGTYDDTITCCGGNTDNELFKNFLKAGGHLYLQGEHQDFYGRNMSLLQFIKDVSGAISYPGVVTTYKQWTNFANTPENFRTDFNTLTRLDTYYPGTILLSGVGNGRPITTDGTYSLDLAFLSSDLAIGNGKMFVNFDSNEFSGDTNCPGGCYTATEEGYYIQNVYDFLADCTKYTLTKTVNPSTICVGQNATYQICYNNIGTKALTGVVVWDTIPNCLSVQGSTSPAPSGNSGQLYWWNIGTVNPGVSACINVVVQATCLP